MTRGSEKSETRRRMLAVGLSPSTLALEAGVSTGTVENIFRRERTGTQLSRMGYAETKVRAALTRLESEQASQATVVTETTDDGDEMLFVMIRGLPAKDRKEVAMDVAKRYFSTHNVYFQRFGPQPMNRAV